MFSVQQKRDISDKIQKILRDTGHPELPEDEIQFAIQIGGAESWSWAEIRNNGSVSNPSVNPHNEAQDKQEKKEDNCSIKWCPPLTLG